MTDVQRKHLPPVGLSAWLALLALPLLLIATRKKTHSDGWVDRENTTSHVGPTSKWFSISARQGKGLKGYLKVNAELNGVLVSFTHFTLTNCTRVYSCSLYFCFSVHEPLYLCTRLSSDLFVCLSGREWTLFLWERSFPKAAAQQGASNRFQGNSSSNSHINTLFTSAKTESCIIPCHWVKWQNDSCQKCIEKMFASEHLTKNSGILGK